MIRAEGVSVSFGANQVLAGVDFATQPGRITALLGPNGSGKSTLLRCLHGGLTPDAGAVHLDDRPITSYSLREIARRVAVVPQETLGALGTTVAEMVLLGRAAHRRDHQSFTREDRRIAAEALAQVGATRFTGRRLSELSGGERQRVLIARCLAQNASILLLDEPTNHLDIRFQHDVLALVRSLGLTTVIVLHDLNLAARYCDEAVVLHAREIVASGPVSKVLRPEILEPVYGIGIRRIQDYDVLHLIFG